MVDKVVRDGKVAVLYSPGYGAGWYTWNYYKGDNESMLFDPKLVELVLAETPSEEIETYANSRWEDIYTGGLEDIQVMWLPVGTMFIVEEYDGSESITLNDKIDWRIA